MSPRIQYGKDVHPSSLGHFESRAGFSALAQGARTQTFERNAMVIVHTEKYSPSTSRWWKYTSIGLVVVLLIAPLFRRNARNSGHCTFSFGRYRGHEYKHESTVGTPICLVESRWMRIQQHAVRVGSSIIDDWLWIDYHDRINVLVEDETQPGEERRFLVFEQSKYALEGRLSMALVGGIIEPGEDAEVAARREVAEEMRGMHCEEFHSLGRFRTDVNRGMGWVNSFLATRCSRSTKKKHSRPHDSGANSEEVGAADTERQDTKSVTLRELREAAISGKFLEVQWSNTVALALLHPELMV